MGNDYFIDTDKARLDLAAIQAYLSESSYWARGRSLETVRTSVENSLCFGAYAVDGSLAGFARVVTDFATFAWLCDVFVLEGHQGRGLGRRLVEAVIGHPGLRGLARFILATRDAHELYRRYGGFEKLQAPELWMERTTARGAGP